MLSICAVNANLSNLYFHHLARSKSYSFGDAFSIIIHALFEIFTMSGICAIIFCMHFTCQIKTNVMNLFYLIQNL